MSERVQFYTNPMSRGQIVRWALHEAGAEYDSHIIGYGAEMDGAAYRAINPMAKVPAIVHGGQVVTECAAICAYLADSFPKAGLAPTPAERADYYRLLFFAAGPVEAAVTAKAMGWHPSEEQQMSAGFGSFERTIDTLVGWFSDRAYVCGDRFTMADVYVGAQIDWGLQFGTMPSKDSFMAYVERIKARLAYQAAKAIDNALIAEMQAPAAPG